MIKKLPLTAEPHERETLPSFFSRMAQINGTEATGFALDLGISFKRILEQDALAIETFAARSGLTPEQRATLLSWTGERVGDVRMLFRGEVFVSRALRNPVVRGCPQCLREQTEGQDHPLRYMSMSGDWLCRGVDICLRHRHPLVPLWSCKSRFERDNIGERLAMILPDLLAGRFECEHIDPSDYDRWIDLRLSQGLDDTWLAKQSLFAAMTFCDLLGAALLRKKGQEVDDRHAKAVGFAVASQGPDSIREALGRLTRAEDGGHIVTKGELKPIFVALDDYYRDDESFDVFRDIVRDHVLKIWPLPTGEEIFGYTLPERRVHSLKTASKETGVGAPVLNDFLIEAGAFEPDDARTDARKTFDAQTYQALLDEIPTLVAPGIMRKVIGATLAELKALEADGVLVPRTKVAKIKSPWRISDGLSLLESLEQLAVQVDGDAPGWETIQLTHKRLGVSVGSIIAAVKDGRLRLGKRTNVFGYHGFVVQITEVVQLKARTTSSVRPQAREGELNAAAFGRSVGIRGNGAFLALIEGGHVPAIKVLHPVTKRPQWRMRGEDIAAFHATFTTPTVLAAETGMHRNTIIAAISAHGVRPFRPDGLEVGPVYLRKDIQPVLRALSGKS